ncbi:uncharacterized protein LOC126811031 isoform X2 [Patella vulgata]|uniref:uncharacterized protein LOC126811031 isoform X2 n=1 Tax=Patella vulgata TaxID=6465 RepID=UPI0024A9945D|nr:uncharacterized protein LOC126811031 isoform X2 [Patella vulgata]
MYNTIKYLLLLTTAVFVIVDCQTIYGCYRQPGSPCSQHTLTCPDDQVIAVNDNGNTYIAYGRNPGEACPQDKMEICNATCCRHQHLNEYVRVNQSYRLSVYRNCSNQPTCTVTSPYSPNTSYDYMRYPYFCVPDNQSHNILEITDVNIQDAAFLYYSGKAKTTSTTITRCCNIASTEPLLVESIYIDLTEESSYNVKIYSENQTLLPSGDGGGLFYGLRDLLISGDKIYHVVLDNIPVDRDDYILIYIQAGSSNTSTACIHDCPNINITCDDCPAPGNSNNNNGDVITGLTVGIIVVSLLLIITWFIGGVYCIRRKMKRTQRSQEGQTLPRPVNASDTCTYAGLVNSVPDTVNNSGPEHHYTGLTNIDGSDTMTFSEPQNSTVPNVTEHGYIAPSNPKQVQPEAPTNVNYENTLANTNEQRSKDNTYLSVIT